MKTVSIDTDNTLWPGRRQRISYEKSGLERSHLNIHAAGGQQRRFTGTKQALNMYIKPNKNSL